MLIQLPNGDWVAPESVLAVSAMGGLHVEVETNVGLHVMKVSFQGEAEALRDQIAEQINKALYRPEGVI